MSNNTITLQIYMLKREMELKEIRYSAKLEKLAIQFQFQKAAVIKLNKLS